MIPINQLTTKTYQLAELQSINSAKLNSSGELEYVCTQGEVRSDLQNTQGVILGPGKLSDRLLVTFGYLPCTLIYSNAERISERAPKTYKLEDYSSSEDRLNLTFRQCLDKAALSRYVMELKKKRNDLLEETDWVESCPDVSAKCRARFRAYRKALRLLFHLDIEPYDIEFPKKPEIVFSSRGAGKELSKDDVDLLKNYSPNEKESKDWNTFIAAWVASKTQNYNYINNLLTAYTGYSINTLRKHVS